MQEVFGFVKRNRPKGPKRSEGRMLLAEKGVRGKGRQPLSPPQLTLTPKREQRFGLKINFRVADHPSTIRLAISNEIVFASSRGY